MSYQKDGTAIGDLVQLQDVGGGTPGLPAVDGSLLLNLPGGGGTSTSQSVAQAAHGLAVGEMVRHNGIAYVKAQADSLANSQVVGMVSAVADADNFTLTTAGLVTGLAGRTAGSLYYLSAITAGAALASAPTGYGQPARAIYIAVSTTSVILVSELEDNTLKTLTVTAESTLTGPTAHTVNSSQGDCFLLCNATAGAVSILTPASPTVGQIIVVKDIAASALTNDITLTANAGQTIDGGASYTLLSNREAIMARYCQSGDWILI